jgi:hypothetical protein
MGWPCKKISDRNPKKMRRLYLLTGIDEEHCCRDIGIVPVAGLLKSKRLLIAGIRSGSMDEVV